MHNALPIIIGSAGFLIGLLSSMALFDELKPKNKIKVVIVFVIPVSAERLMLNHHKSLSSIKKD